MVVRRWIGLGALVAIAAAAAFVYRHASMQRIREDFTGPLNEPRYQSQLLSEVFDTVADREPPYRPAPKGELEFNNQIAPIIYGKCARCHYVAGVAPFALGSFGDVKKRARRIAQAVSRGLMPPWRADRCSLAFAGDFSLTNEEKGMLEQWLAEGCREGDRAKAPPPPTPPPEWRNGPPDVILQPAEAFHVAAEGPDLWRWFVMPTNYLEDRYVRLADVSPGSKAVHHVAVFSDTSGMARRLDAAAPGPGFAGIGFPEFPPASEFGQWEPGMFAPPLPDGIGYFLPKGADLVIQVHYHPTGKEEIDRSRVALYFCDKPVDKRLRCLPVIVSPRVLNIRPGEANVVFWAEEDVPGDISVVQIFPHMHLVGREIAAAATLPDGSKIPIIRISDWDFRWQTLYMLKTPLRLPAGTRIRLEARFDNSSANPRNPHQPPKPIRFGLKSGNEMCMISLLYTVDAERLTEGRPAASHYPDTFFPERFRRVVSGRKQIARSDAADLKKR